MTLFESAALGLVLAALVVKPSELPPLARRLGRTAGRAVNRLEGMKRELGEYVEKNELRSVQDELEQTMGQLNRIRHEVRSVSSVRGMMMDFASGSGRNEGAVRDEHRQRDAENRMDDLGSPGGRPAKGLPGAGMHVNHRGSATPTVPYAVLPVSARDVQLARHANGKNNTNECADKKTTKNACDETTGSGILKASLEEERVAKTAAQFFASGGTRD
jgi:Sec-independent protein translocase protein TatA